MRSRIPLSLVVFLLTLQGASGQETPKKPKLEILTPAAGEKIQGRVDVSVRITSPPGAPVPAVVQAGLGGAYWVVLAKAGNDGHWTGSLDSTMVPNRKQQFLVVTDVKRLGAARAVEVENPLRSFWADLHGHTSYSDGVLTPAAAHSYARDVAKLDVFSLTDHLEQINDQEWRDSREVADDFNQDGRFVTIPGLEWTTRWGHINIFDPKTRHWPADSKKFYAALAADDVVAKFNHPADGTQALGGLAHSKTAHGPIRMIEVRNGEEQAAYVRALANGWHVAPDGSTDTHAANWGNLRTWTVILAPGLSRACIWDAMHRGRQYSTQDRNCRLVFEVNGATMGDVIDKAIARVETLVRVDDPDQNDAVAKIELFEDGKLLVTEKPTTAGGQWTTTQSPSPGRHYYFVKVVQADGNTMWSAPVWLKVRGR